MYLLAIFFPPLAVWFRKGFLAALLNFLLCFLGFIPGVIHALIVVSTTDADRRASQLDTSIKNLTMANLSMGVQAQQKNIDSTKASYIDEIERLASLKERGLITEEEFEAKKSELMA